MTEDQPTDQDSHRAEGSAQAEKPSISPNKIGPLAYPHARRDKSFYGKLKRKKLAWEVLSVDDTGDLYQVHVSYRLGERYKGEPGEEQFTFDKSGQVLQRQIGHAQTRLSVAPYPGHWRARHWCGLVLHWKPSVLPDSLISP